MKVKSYEMLNSQSGGHSKIFRWPTEEDGYSAIGSPLQVSDGEWKCLLYISNIGLNEIEYAHGVDALQSLMLAFQHARFYLLKSGLKRTWYAGRDGDCGIPANVPDFGRKMTEHLVSVIDHEIERIVRSHKKKRMLVKRCAVRKRSG